MTRTSGLIVLGSIVALVAAIVLGVSFGHQPVSFADALADPSSDARYVLVSVRLPHVLLAAVAGAGLSVVGVALQALLRNPLAEPYVLGVSGGAAAGATLAIVVGVSSATALGASVVPLFALGGGLVATALVHAIAAAAPDTRGTSLLLAGVVVNAIASALITFVKTLVSHSTLQELLYWLTGFIDDAPSRAALPVMSTYVALGVALVLRDAGRLNVLALGEDAAAHLGVPVRVVERRIHVASAIIVGAIVSVTGLIGFVGLLVPHALRRVLGPDVRRLMPASLGYGGATLVVCDCLSRAAFRLVGRDVPVGAVTALVGGTLFLLLLRRRA